MFNLRGILLHGDNLFLLGSVSIIHIISKLSQLAHAKIKWKIKRFCFVSIIPDYLRFISEYSLYRMGEKPSLEAKDIIVFLCGFSLWVI